MAKKITRTVRSDGSVEETVTVKKGFVYYGVRLFAILFVIVMCVQYWWLGVIIGLLFVLGVVGGIAKRKNA